MRNRFIIITLMLLSIQVSAQGLDRVQGQIIVKMTPTHRPQSLIHKINNHFSLPDFLALEKIISQKHKIYLLSFDENVLQGETVLTYIQTNPNVQFAQFNNCYQQRDSKPDDEYFEEQWDMNIIDAPAVWNQTSGGLTVNGDSIVVAVIDTGFDAEHEDLRANVWHNYADLPNDSLDNDNNGFVDDHLGWNFKFSNDDHNTLNNTGLNHGTGAAGIIGASGNNELGVTGVNWNVKLMLLTVIGTDDQIASAYFYALEQRKLYNESNGDKGALVVATSISLGRAYATIEDFPLWCELFDLMGKEGILSAGATANEGYDVDKHGDIPTSCTSEYLLSVTNTNDTDTKELGAAWGKESIDLGAPGSTCFTTKVTVPYGNFNGTSAATPHVAGAIALLYSLPCEQLANDMMLEPEGTALLVKDFILNGTNTLSDLEQITVSGGRLNIKKSMELMRLYCGSTIGPLKINIYPNPVDLNNNINLVYETPDYDFYNIRIYNTLGQCLQSQTIRPPDFEEKKTTISTQNLAVGIYFISIESSNNTTIFTDRFVVK